MNAGASFDIARPSPRGWRSLPPSAAPRTAALAVCRRLLFDMVGPDHRRARTRTMSVPRLRAALDEGPLHRLGHAKPRALYDAALVNGTAAHGEDYDDTFEGGPIHAGAVIVSAVLAIAEQRGLDGEQDHARDCGRNGTDVPHEPRGAAGDAQGGLPSDRDLRRAGGRSRGWCGRSALDAGATGARSGNFRKSCLGHHRVSRRWQLDKASACRRGGAGRLARRASGRGRIHRPFDGV